MAQNVTMAELIPSLVPFDAWAAFESDPTSEIPGEIPIAVLDFAEHPHAELLFHDLLDADPDSSHNVTTLFWRQVDGEPEMPYFTNHAAHPIIRFLVEPATTTSTAPQETIAFLVCVMCHASFMHAITQSCDLAIIRKDTPMLDLVNLRPAIPTILTKLDPDDVATSELWAWRYAFRDANISTQPPG